MERLQTLIFYPLKIVNFDHLYLGSSWFLYHCCLLIFVSYETSYRLI